MSTDNLGVSFPDGRHATEEDESGNSTNDDSERESDDNENNSNNSNDDDNAAPFSTTAAGAFDDDALAATATGVTYGPTFYPTDDDFLPRTSTALDRRLWQQVLDLHAAAQQPEPLHELAILAEQQPDLMGLPPMGADHNHNNNNNSHDPVDHAIGPPHNLNAAMNHLANHANMHINNTTNTHNNTNINDSTAAVAAFPPLNERKRSDIEDITNNDNNNTSQHHHDNINLPQQQQQQQNNNHSFRTASIAPKKRRLVVPQHHQQKQQQQPTSHVRKQYNQASMARRVAFRHWQDVEQEYARVQQRLDQARNEFDKANETMQSMTETLVDDLLQDDTSWNANYRLLRNYYRRHGHTNIPRRPPTEEQLQEEPDLAKLGRWVGEQRRDYRLSLDNPDRLEEYKIMALQRLGFDFDPMRTAWERQYNALKSFYETHGHTRVPYRPASDYSLDHDEEEEEAGREGCHEEHRSLGSWVKRQRYQYRLYQEGEPSDMTPERIQLLNKIKFEWQIRGTTTWDDHYQELKDYYHQHSNTLIPCSRKALYEWTQEQRQQLRLYDEDPNQSELSDDQVKLLKQLGLADNLREGKWYRRFQELLAFQRQHGHCILPSHYPYNHALVNWCSTQRRQYKLLTQGKKSQLTSDRVRLLDNAGFEWEVSSHQRANAKLNKTWQELYAEAAYHRDQFSVLDGIPKDSELYRWCQEQRLHYQWLKEGQSSPLTPQQKEQLDQLGISWDNRDGLYDSHQQSWESMYSDLLVYRLNHGTFNVPSKFKELHDFVKEQRREYVKFKDEIPSQLNSDRIQKLNAVKFPWKAPKLSDRKSWEENFGELLTFRLQNNSFNVPKHLDESLHKWTWEQRKMYQDFHDKDSSDAHKDAIIKKRIEKLEEINFPWH